jgi:hypothetical protein
MRIISVLLFAAAVLAAAAYWRGPEYDEAYSIFLTAGHARPAWPTGIFLAGDVRHLYAGSASPARIAMDLRSGDVHPPLYFWVLEYWRRLAGPSWFAARLLSVGFSLASLAALGRLAALAEVPVVPTLLITLLSYGFAYTGVVARGFALAQLLNMIGVTCIFAAHRKSSWRFALAGGLAFGAAGFSNYLAVFTGLAAFAWLTITSRSWRLILPAAAGFALFLPGQAWFFIAQKSSRIGQFTAFSFRHAIILLCQDAGAALFGGLPVYAGGFGRDVTAALVALICVCAYFVWRGRRPEFLLFALAAAAAPAGLLALGLVFHNTPIEIRYLAFGLPFAALLLAGSLPMPLLWLVLAVQAAAILGLIAAPATMQPQARAARQAAALAPAGALILLPFGQDGVGIAGPFIASAPAAMRILLIRPGAMPDLGHAQPLVIIRLGIDPASRTALYQLADLLGKNPCWRAGPATNLAEVENYTCGR